MPNEINLDTILAELDKFGRTQFLYFAMLCFLLILTGAHNSSYIFTAGDLNYRCYIDECDIDTMPNEYSTAWLSYAVPFNKYKNLPSQCYRYGGTPVNQSVVNCTTDMFDRDTIVKCNRFVYENDERTILNEFDLNCDTNKWKLALPGTVRSIGLLCNLFLIGYFSDKFGRKAVLVVSPIVAATIGLMQTFAWSYWSFIGFKFLEAALGSGTYSAAVILAIEFVDPKHRGVSGTLIFAASSSGKIYLGTVAMLLQNWKSMKRINYIPSYLALAYIWLMPESLRWLLAKRRFREMAKILLRIAKWNRTPISDEIRDLLTHSPHLIAQEENKSLVANRAYPIGDVIRSRGMILRMAGLSFCWITNVFVFHGLTLTSVSIGGNKYHTFMITSFMEILACIFVMVMSNRVGRKRMLSTAFTLSGTSLLLYTVFNANLWLKLIIFMAGKFSITVAFTTTYLYTSELLPTNMRHTLLGICSAFGRIGTILAPQAPLLELVVKHLSIYLFAGSALAAGFLTFQFPETLNTTLPDTIEEALCIGKRRVIGVKKKKKNVML